jgi:hypothetical protein
MLATAAARPGTAAARPVTAAARPAALALTISCIKLLSLLSTRNLNIASVPPALTRSKSSTNSGTAFAVIAVTRVGGSPANFACAFVVYNNALYFLSKSDVVLK